MRFILAVVILVICRLACADARADIGAALAGEGSCFDKNGNSIGRRDFTEREAREIDAAIPCSQIVIDGIDGTPGAGSLNDFNAGMNTRHIIYSEIVRQQEAELDCKAGSMGSLAKTGGAGHNELIVASMNAFAKLRSNIVRLKELAASRMAESGAAMQRAVMGNARAPDPTESNRLEKESVQATEDLRKLLSRIPFGNEPEVQAALTRLSVALPADLTSQDSIRTFEAAYSNALTSSSKKYSNARQKLDGLFVPLLKTTKGKTLGGDINEDDNLWRTFGAAQSFKSFADSLNVRSATRQEITCSLDARYRRGPELMQAADFAINASGLVAAVATAVFPPSAVVTAPVIAFASAYQAAGAVYYVNEAVKECSSPSTRYTIVTGNQCTQGDALAAKEIKQSENSTCGGNIGNAALAAGGMTLEALSTARAGRVLAAAAADERAGVSTERALTGANAERAAVSNERNAAASVESTAPAEVEEIVVTAPVRAPQLSEAARADAQASLRQKGITDENLTSFFNKDAPIALSNNERIYLFEKYSGLKLKSADAKELLRLHNIGPGYGRYSLAQLREKAEGIKALLLKNGITDPDEIKRVINLTLRNGVAGQVRETAEQRTLIQKVLDLIGKGPRATQAAADRQFAAELANAQKTYKSTGLEVLDVNRASSRYNLARRISGSDTFGNAGSFRGTFDELLTSGAYADNGRYSAIGGRDLWWQDVSIAGRESRSPVNQITGDAGDVERRIFWQKDQNVGRAATTYDTQFSRMGIAENRVNGELHSVEGIARRPDGSIEFFYYVKDGQGLKPALSFKGEPIPQACIKCHQHPSRPGIATQVPYAIFQKTGLQGASQSYQTSLARLIESENLPPVIPDRLGRPNTIAPKIREAPATNRAELRSDSQRNRAQSITSRVGVDRDAQLRESERIVGRRLDGRESLQYKRAVGNAGEVRFNARGRTPEQVRGEQYSYLRYNMERAEVRAYQKANAGKSPPEIFTADEADRILREGVFGSVPRPSPRNP